MALCEAWFSGGVVLEGRGGGYVRGRVRGGVAERGGRFAGGRFNLLFIVDVVDVFITVVVVFFVVAALVVVGTFDGMVQEVVSGIVLSGFADLSLLNVIDHRFQRAGHSITKYISCDSPIRHHCRCVPDYLALFIISRSSGS